MTQLNRRQALKLVGGLGAGMVAAACGADDPPDPLTVPQKPVRVGVLVPQTGALKVIGEEITNGFQLYLDRHGGRFGRYPVELVKADEGESIRSGMTALDLLLAEKVAAIVGVANSALLDAAQARIERARVPVLSTNGTPRGSRTGFYIWSTSYAEHEPGLVLAPYVSEVVGRDERVAIVAPSTASGRDAVEGFRSAFGAGSRLAPTIWTPPRVTASRQTFAGPVQQIVNMGAAAVFCYYAGPAAVEFLRALRQSGSRAKVYAPGMITEGAVLSELGGDGAGIMTALNYSADLRNAVNQRFSTVYRRTHGFAPSAAAVASYDAAQAIDKAIHALGTEPSAWTVYEGLYKVGQIDSPRGLWQFSVVRTPSQRWFLRTVRRDGPVLSNVTVRDLGTLG